MRCDRGVTVFGPLRSFAAFPKADARCVSRPKSRPGSRLRFDFDARLCEPFPLRCSVLRPGAELTSFAALTAFRQPRPVSLRSALRARAESPGLASRAGPGGPAVRKAQAVPRTACVPADLLGVEQALRRLPCRAFAGASFAFVANTQAGGSRQAVPGRGDFCGDEKRRPAVGARSALRRLTRRSCSNAANAVRAVSSATRPRAEHRSAVGAQRRPPQHEPLAGSACRAAPTLLRCWSGKTPAKLGVVSFQWRPAARSH